MQLDGKHVAPTWLLIFTATCRQQPGSQLMVGKLSTVLEPRPATTKSQPPGSLMQVLAALPLSQHQS